jgi:hypothetical protein
MTDREKVIDELNGMVKVCAIYGDDEAIETLNSAISMLREQEPRVLTLEELQAIETPWNRNTPPYLFVEERSGTGSRWTRWMSWGIIHDGVRAQGTMGVQNYGSKWRIWNLNPTPEQMRDTPWEEPDV